MIPVLVQQVEAEIGGQTIQRQALGIRFETPDQQSPDIVAGVETPVLVVQRGQMDAGAERLNFGDGLGQNVEMLAGIERHIGARHRRHLARPEPAGNNHLLGLDDMVAHFNARYPPGFPSQAGNSCVLKEAHPLRLCPFRQGKRHIRGIHPPVGGRPDGAHHVIRFDQGPQVPGMGGVDHLRFQPEGTAQRHLPIDIGKPILIRGEREAAGLYPTRGLPGLPLQLAVEVHRIVYEPGQCGRRPQSAHQSCGMPRGARGQFGTFQHHDVLPPLAGEVVGDRTTDHAATDDDRAGLTGKRHSNAPSRTMSDSVARNAPSASSIRSGVWAADVSPDVWDIMSTPCASMPSR